MDPLLMTDPVSPAGDLPDDGRADAAATAPAPAAAPALPPNAGGRGATGKAGRGQPAPRANAAPRAASGAPRPKSGARPPHPVLQRLFELYPKMFGARFLPLKLGVFQELMARHAEEFKKEDLKLALGLHARSTRYLESVASGLKRHDLNGEPVEDVAPEHVHHAILEVFRRRQARSREDMSPWLRERLVRAIEASGLPRQEYAERFRSADAALEAVLQQALAEVSERAARREALRRAYEASGRTPAEFAEMYGVELAVVRRALVDPVAPRLSAAVIEDVEALTQPEGVDPSADPDLEEGSVDAPPAAVVNGTVLLEPPTA